MVSTPPGSKVGSQGSEWSQPTGDWLARIGGTSFQPELPSLDGRLCAGLLEDLRKDPPPGFAEVAAQIAEEAISGPQRSSSRGSRPNRSAVATPPTPEIQQAAPPGSGRSARSLILERARLPPAGAAVSALRPRGLAGARVNVPPLQSVPRSPSGGAEVSDKSLVSSMVSRLAQVEKLNQQQAAKLTRQSQEIDVLRAELEILRRVAEVAEELATGKDEDDEDTPIPATRIALEEVKQLKAERDRYKRQVEEMTKFLEDYGLHWVGDTGSEVSEGEPEQSEEPAMASERSGGDSLPSRPPKPSRPGQTAGITVDIHVIQGRVESLNAMVEKEGAKVVSDRRGGAVHARLVADDALPLPLTFFQDGVKLGDRAFQAYELRPTQQLLRDILDGFFPYTLKDEFPNGVALKVVDRTAYSFKEWLRDLALSDVDLMDAGDRLAPAGGRVLRPNAPGANRNVAAERFLQKLPEKVLRGGRICEVRGPIEQQLRGNASARGTSAPAVAAESAGAGSSSSSTSAGEVSLLAPGRDASAPVARLQVKLEGGQRLVLCMEVFQTVGDIEDALTRWSSSTGAPRPRRGSLRTAFPPQTYSDRQQTLQAAGLTPTATLFVASEPQ